MGNKGIEVRIEVDGELMFKLLVNKDTADVKHLIGCVAEGVGKSLKDNSSVGY